MIRKIKLVEKIYTNTYRKMTYSIRYKGYECIVCVADHEYKIYSTLPNAKEFAKELIREIQQWGCIR